MAEPPNIYISNILYAIYNILCTIFPTVAAAAAAAVARVGVDIDTQIYVCMYMPLLEY